MGKALSVAILADASGFTKGLKEAESRTHKFAKVAAGAGLALSGTLVVGLKKSVDAAKDAQRVQAQTEAQLKALGISYQAHRSEIDKVINSTSKLAAIDDEELQGAFNDLTRATGSVSKGLKDVGIAADVARGAHVSLERAQRTVLAAEQGRITALRRLGIDMPKVTTAVDALKASHHKYTAAQLAAAKATDANATRQQALAALQQKFAGSAEAYGKTAAGSQERFGIALENLEESLGTVLLPTLQKVADVGTRVADYFEKHATQAKILVGAVGLLGGALIAASIANKAMAEGTALNTVVTKLAAVATKGWAAAQWLLNIAMDANPIGLIIVGLAALAVGLKLAWDHSETFRDIVTGAFDKVKEVGQGIADFVTKTIPQAFQDVKDWVTDHWPEIATLISGPFAPLVLLATDAFGVRSKLEGAFKAVKTYASDRIDDIVGFFSGMGKQIWDGFSATWDTVKGSFLTAFNTVKEHASTVISNVVTFFTDLPGKIGDAIGGAMHFLKDKLGELFSWKKIVGWIKDALGFGSPSPHFMGIGHDIVDSMVRGVGAAAGLLKDAVSRLATDLLGSLGGGIGGAIKGEFGGHGATILSVLLGFAKAEGIPVTSTRGGDHVKDSYHYQGRAIDVAGSFAQMQRFFLDAIKTFTVPGIKELFYDPMGYYVDNGAIHRGAIGGHSDHVHLALGKGGIVTAPTMALIGEKGPEAVVPLNRYAAGGEVVVHTHVYLDGKQITETTRRELLRLQQRNGNLGFT